MTLICNIRWEERRTSDILEASDIQLLFIKNPHIKHGIKFVLKSSCNTSYPKPFKIFTPRLDYEKIQVPPSFTS